MIYPSLDVYEVIQFICRKSATVAVVWKNNRLLSTYVFIYTPDKIFYVYVFRGSLQPDATHMHDIDVDLNIGKVQKVKFLWNNNVINLFRPKLGASRITVQGGEDRTECVSFIPSKVLFSIFSYQSVHQPIHSSIQSPTYASMHLSTNTCIQPFLFIHLSVHSSIQPSIQTPVVSCFWPSSQLSIHLPNYSPQLSIYPSSYF